MRILALALAAASCSAFLSPGQRTSTRGRRPAAFRLSVATQPEEAAEAASLMLDGDDSGGGVNMGNMVEPKHAPKAGENDYGGGDKFKRMIELAKQRKAEGYQTTAELMAQSQTATAETTTSTTTTTTALPADWASAVDPASGKTYYYNRASGETTWESPAVVVTTTAPQEEEDEPNPTEEVERLKQVLKATRLQLDELKERFNDKTIEVSRMEMTVEVMTDKVASKDKEIAKLKKMLSEAQNKAKEDKPVVAETTPPPAPKAEEKVEPIAQTTTEPTTTTSATTTPPVTPEPEAQSSKDALALKSAAMTLDAATVSSLFERGVEMDASTVDAAFWAVVNAVDRAERENKALPADVARMLHHVFEADHKLLLKREKQTTNVTCMQPAETGLTTHGMNYIFDDQSHKDLPLIEGRRCEDGNCCDACSRNIFPTFATDAEINLDTFPEFAKFTFNELESVATGTILHFTRLVERVRRTIAHEYGLPLSTVLPLQAYSRKYVAGSTQQGGGGGEGDFVTLHTDESTHTGYHYSCVLYLSTQGVDFEGGDFIFNDAADPDDENAVMVGVDEEEDGPVLSEDGTVMPLAEQIRRVGRKFTPFHPTRGAAVIFSSGWENMHEVNKITSGTRYAVPCFFTTCPVPDIAYDQMVQGKPKSDEDIADDWLHLLLAHRSETPQESVGRVKELLMKWHYMCSPLSEH